MPSPRLALGLLLAAVVLIFPGPDLVRAASPSPIHPLALPGAFLFVLAPFVGLAAVAALAFAWRKGLTVPER